MLCVLFHVMGILTNNVPVLLILNIGVTHLLFCSSTESKLYCSYCNVQCSTEVDLHLHCIGAPHQAVIMSDDGRDWRYRPPPRGFTSDEYALCTE